MFCREKGNETPVYKLTFLMILNGSILIVEKKENRIQVELNNKKDQPLVGDNMYK